MAIITVGNSSRNMKTKVVVIGEYKHFVKEPKPIELCYLVSSQGQICPSSLSKASEYANVELIAKSYCQKDTMDHDESGDMWDLIFCYHDPELRGAGILYFGNWNDGVV